MIESEYFTVTSETKDFVVVKLNPEVIFNGRNIRFSRMSGLTEFTQHLLDEHGLLQLCTDGFGSLMCRKVKGIE
jgi:hypothetical protein